MTRPTPLVLALSAAVLVLSAAVAVLLVQRGRAGVTLQGIVDQAVASDGKTVLFSVGDRPLHREQFEDEYELLLKFSDVPEEMAAQYRANIQQKQMLLDGMQKQFLLILDGRDRNLFTNQVFKNYMRKTVRDAAFQYVLMSSLGREITVSDEDVAHFYNQNKSQFQGGFSSETEIKLRGYLKQTRLQEILEKRLVEIRGRHPVKINDTVDLYGIKQGR
jgi:AraC-like DNA-binding protein